MNAEVWKELHGILSDLGPPIITVFGVWLGWRLGTQSQRRQRRLDVLNSRFAALRQLMQLSDVVPPNIDDHELLARFETNDELYRGLVLHLVRLLGLRHELPPYLEPEVRDFIDHTFKPLFGTWTGRAEVDPTRKSDFATAAVRFRELVYALEVRLAAEHEKLIR